MVGNRCGFKAAGLFSINTRGPRKITHILISTELLKKTNRVLQMQELIEKKDIVCAHTASWR